MEATIEEYVERGAEEYRQWCGRDPKVWNSIGEAETEASTIVAKMKGADATAEQTRQALLECSLWHPPLLAVEGHTLYPRVMALVRSEGRVRRVKLRIVLF